MMPLWSKLALPRESQVRTKEQRWKTSKLFFSETAQCRALIFGMKDLLVDLFQVKIQPLGSKLAPAQGGHKFEHRNKGKLQNSSQTGRRRALIFGMLRLLVDLYQVFSYDAPEVKTSPAPRSQFLKREQRRRTSKFFFSETGRRRASIFDM